MNSLLEGTNLFAKDGSIAPSSSLAQSKVLESIGDVLIKPNGTTVDAGTALDGKYLGIYFGSHWYDPCKQFTQHLVQAYNKIKSHRKDFEIVFVSDDRNENSFKYHHRSMPWLALPYNERNRGSDLRSLFEVEGIFGLVLLGPDGQVINTDGVGALCHCCDELSWFQHGVDTVQPGVGELNQAPEDVVCGENAGGKVPPSTSEAIIPERLRSLRALADVAESLGRRWYTWTQPSTTEGVIEQAALPRQLNMQACI